MTRYKKYQFTDEGHPLKGLWYARSVIEETLGTEVLAKHMANHNISYSTGLIKEVFTDMIACTKELILDGKNVKPDDLAIFFIDIVSEKDAVPAAEFALANSVKGLKLRACAIGELSNAQINLEGQLKGTFKYNADNGSGDGGSAPGGNGEEEESPLGQAFHPSDKRSI